MVVAEYVPEPGDIIKTDFSVEQAGHEQAGWRPALVLSRKEYNKKVGLAVVVPITSEVKGYPFEVNLPANLKITGTILSDAVRSIDWRERKTRYCDKVSAEILRTVQAKLAALLGLPKP
jgi:mRNA interferase MazF